MSRVFSQNVDEFPIDSRIAPFLSEAIEVGYRPYYFEAANNIFGVANAKKRFIEFVYRGRGRVGWRGCWGVFLESNGKFFRLGPFFGLTEHACVVVQDTMIREVSFCWLTNDEIETVLSIGQFYHRTKMERPLVLQRYAHNRTGEDNAEMRT